MVGEFGSDGGIEVLRAKDPDMNLIRRFALVGGPLLFMMTSGIAAMPEPDAWNIGSVLAAAQRCEMNNFIPQGQATPIMTKLFSVLTPTEQQFIRTGYLEGNKRDSVYSISQKQWLTVPLTEPACSKVQYALDQYKSISSAGGSQNLTGLARENFVKETSNGCMRAKMNDEDTKSIPNSLFEGHCLCYANALANKLTIADIRSDNKAVADPIMKAAALSCYQAMKAKALELYNAGRYPKQ
jgi:hypothetical protein